MTTQWEKMEVSADMALKLKDRGYAIWSRLMDGEHIFTVRSVAETPSEGDGGYRSISAALKTKGLL